MGKQTILQGTKYRWHLPAENNQQKINDIATTHHITPAIAQTLHSRGFQDHDHIRSFLFSSFEKDVADPRKLKGAQKAVERILLALKKKEKILIFGDYDVDGITSTSLFLLALLPLKANINYFLPNRVRDGYGLSEKIVRKAVTSGYSLIITVDNGITAHTAAHVAKELKIDLIITDHHRPHGTLPVALAIVNPNQKDCPFPHKGLAGVGVTFKIISLLYEEKKLSLPEKIYELLMLGTIADVVPLVDENRYWVRHGLAKTNKQRSFAMSVLAKNNRLTKSRFDSLDMGFMIAPQLNALGRLDDSREAVKFMISSDKNEVQRIGAILKNINEKRKQVDRRIYQEVEASIVEKQIDLENEWLIMAASHQWPAGVIGLVAGKLMHNYGRPAILFHLTNDGFAKGSCRSIKEFNMFDALEENKDLLLSFGGHSLAAGLKLKTSDVAILKQRIEEKLRRELTKDQLQPKLLVDADLTLPEMTKKILTDLERLEPFGNANQQPIFSIKNVQIQKAPQLLKDAHVKCTIFADGVIKPVIFFNRPDLYTILQELGEKPFHLAGHVTKNEWMGSTTIQLQGLDIALF